MRSTSAAEVARVSAQAIRCPREDAVEFARADIFQEFVEHFSLADGFCGMGFLPDLRDLEPVPLGDLDHLLDLAVY